MSTVILRDMVFDDLDHLVRWRNDPEVSRYLADRLKTRQEAETWLTRLGANSKVWRKVILLDGRIIGYGAVESIDEKSRKCELALVIGEPECWGQGIAGQVVREMLRYAFVDLKMHRVFAATVRGNERSMRLITRSGFREEGSMREAILLRGTFVDLLCYSMLEQEYVASLI
ncbi:MAG: GNAT family N-acetyltransferase [Candidatus Zixiibacteriota bacterium]